MRSKFALAMVAVLLAVACSPSAQQQLPTLIPSATPPPATATNPPATESPTPTGPTPTAPYVPQSIANSPSQQVYVRIVHAAPDVPAIDVYVELLAVATNLNYAQNTEPSGVVAGDYILRVVPAGNTPTDSPRLEQTLSLQGGQSLVLLVHGSLDALDTTIVMEATEPLPFGQSRITAINAMSGGPMVSLMEGNTELFNPIAAGQVSTPVTLSTGRTTLTFQGGDSTLVSHLIDLREQHNHTLVLVGTPANIRVVEFDSRAPSQASIRFVNASAPIGTVDVTFNSELLVSNAGFGRASEQQHTIAQIYDVEIYATGADRTEIAPLLSTQLVANQDDVITLILIGTPDALQLVQHRENSAPTAPLETRIAFLNTLPNLPVAQLDVAQGQVPGITTLNYAQTPAEVAILAGNYTFYWANAAGDLLEVAENIQLEAGRSYLYLFTGRLDNAPVIVSSNVGIDEELVSSVVVADDLATAEVATVPMELRVVNAVSGIDFPIDFMLDGTLLTAGLNYRQGSELIEVSEGDHTVDVTVPETSNALGSTSAFLDAGRYSVFASGFGEDSVQVLLAPDYPLIFDGTSPHLRLVNLSPSGSDANFGLAYSAANTTVNNPDAVSVDSGDIRRSIPFGLQRLVDNIMAQNFSGPVLMPAAAFDIHILDTAQNSLAATIPNVTLAAGAHYDVIAYQEGGSRRVQGFILQYPVRSG